ncbi:MAG: EamA family transporter, partial [Candidatus Omnitrophica bacterium]|nr:EamA family transporter [Candidatus Omnitrophota bacterium]
VVILYCIGVTVDKMGMRSSTPLTWSFVLNVVVAAILRILMRFKVKDARRQIKANLLWLVLIGLCLAVLMMFQMNALKMAIVSYVIAIKRTSIIMTSLWGLWFLKEKGAKERMLAVVFMVAGVLVISFSN